MKTHSYFIRAKQTGEYYGAFTGWEKNLTMATPFRSAKSAETYAKRKGLSHYTVTGKLKSLLNA